MGEPVTVPLWLFLPIAAFALWSLLDWLLIPSGRWLLRRRLNRLIDSVNRRLDVEIAVPAHQAPGADRPSGLGSASRRGGQRACPHQQPAARSSDATEVYRYVREIVPAFNAYIYFRVGYGSPVPSPASSTACGWVSPTSARWLAPPGTAVVFGREPSAATWTTCWWPSWRPSARRFPTPSANGRASGRCSS
jgi:hypothetical protein